MLCLWMRIGCLDARFTQEGYTETVNITAVLLKKLKEKDDFSRAISQGSELYA